MKEDIDWLAEHSDGWCTKAFSGSYYIRDMEHDICGSLYVNTDFIPLATDYADRLTGACRRYVEGRGLEYDTCYTTYADNVFHTINIGENITVNRPTLAAAWVAAVRALLEKEAEGGAE